MILDNNILITQHTQPEELSLIQDRSVPKRDHIHESSCSILVLNIHFLIRFSFSIENAFYLTVSMAMNEDVLIANTIAAHNSLQLFPCTSITGTIIEDDILSALDKLTNTTHLLKTEIFLMVFTNYLSNQVNK